MDQKKIKAKLVEALKIAQSAWKEAEMPFNGGSYAENAGRMISIVILATKAYDQLEDE